MKRQPDAKWLRDMAREVANEPVPDVDWDRVEQRVFQALEEPGRPMRLPTPAPVWPKIAAIAAIAAGIALGVTWTASDTAAPHGNTPSATVVHAASNDGAVTASAGAELVTDDRPMTVEHNGWAQFRLAANSRLLVQRLDDHVALQLLEGKVDASVNKRSGDEIFTVRVEDMRVAVRGTVFSVERMRDTLRVEVQRGSVAVGPVASGAGAEWLVSAPSAGMFSLSQKVLLSTESSSSSPMLFGKTEEPPPGEVGPTLAPTLAPSGGVGVSKSAPSASASLPESLTKELASASLANIAREVESCYRRNMPRGNEGVTIHAQTTVNIRIAPDGHVVFARFDPPLAPEAQACASGVVQSATFPRARTESVLVLPLVL